MKFATTWMDIEIIILSEVRKRKIPYGITYTWNPKKIIQINYLQNRGYQKRKGRRNKLGAWN